MNNIFKALFMATFFSILLPDETGGSAEVSSRKVENAQKLGFIPGVGQFYNGKYLKGALIVMSEIYSISMANKFSSNIVKRNSFIWLSIGIYIYSIIDAYIDAELASFPDKDNLLKEEGK